MKTFTRREIERKLAEMKRFKKTRAMQQADIKC
jgi:hypothetical protein